MQAFANNRFVVVKDLEEFREGVLMFPIAKLKAIDRKYRNVGGEFGVLLC